MGYGYGSSSLTNAVIGGTVLSVVIVIAGLVLTILACVKFLGKNGDRSSWLGRLFNFDHLFVETIMKVVYIISVIGITLGCLWFVLATAFAGNVGVFFASLFGGVIMFFVLQLLCRLSFEMTMAFVRMSSDVHAMRAQLKSLLEEHEQLSRRLTETVTALIKSRETFAAAGEPLPNYEVPVPKDSPLIGKSIGALKFWQSTGGTIVAIRRGQTVILSPGPYAELYGGDIIVLVGNPAAAEAAHHLVSAKE